MIRPAFVTTFCPHHRRKTFETLSKIYPEITYFFFSAGDEWYWQQQHGVKTGNFRYEYLPGFRIGKTRIAPTLPLKLWQGHFDVYIKCINGKFALPVTYLIARMKRKPFILWTGIWMRIQTPIHRIFYPLTRYIYHHADAVVVYGDHIREHLVSEGVSSKRIFTAWHAVDNSTYNRPVTEEELAALRQKLNLLPEQKIILYLGRLEDGKGLNYLIEAFASTGRKDCVLVMAGAGSEQPKLVEQSRRAGIAEKVLFPGYIEPEDTVAYYALASVYVLPSITTKVFKEPWGLVVNEAFNQGLPVIATDAVGAAAGGLIQHGYNGLNVPERDATALAEAINCTMDDPKMLKRLGDHARQTVASWDNEKMVSGFQEAIEYVMSKKSSL